MKTFFSEEKNQKTFDFLATLCCNDTHRKK